MEYTVAHIEMNSEVWVYMTYNGNKDVFDKKRCKDRSDALRFIRDAYPDSDIRTVARFA